MMLVTLGVALLPGASARARQPASAPAELVVVKAGTSEYHQPGCAVVRDGNGVLALSRAQAHGRGLKAHPACDPANPSAAARGSAAGTAAAPEPTRTVYVDGPRYYHRDRNCSRLDSRPAMVKPLPLEAAAKSHWPCPACKPPILKRNTDPAVPGTNRRRGR